MLILIKKAAFVALMAIFIYAMVACNQNEMVDEANNKPIDDISVQSSSAADTVSNENSGLQQAYSESNDDSKNWANIPECFFGEYSQELGVETGKDADGKKIWGTYKGNVKISKDSISLDLPEGKFELTSKNSTLRLNNFLEIVSTDSPYSFIIYNQENLMGGANYIDVQINNGNYVNQHRVEK